MDKVFLEKNKVFIFELTFEHINLKKIYIHNWKAKYFLESNTMRLKQWLLDVVIKNEIFSVYFID